MAKRLVAPQAERSLEEMYRKYCGKTAKPEPRRYTGGQLKLIRKVMATASAPSR